MRRVKVSKRAGYAYDVHLRIAFGPRNLANPGSGTLQELFGYAWAMYIDCDTNEFVLMQAKLPDSSPWYVADTDTLDTASWEVIKTFQVNHDVNRIRMFDFTFDQSANEIVAYHLDNDRIYIKQWDQAVMNYIYGGPYIGKDVVLINDGVVNGALFNSDVILFYLSQDRKTLYFRVQRENYNVERIVRTFSDKVSLLTSDVQNLRILLPVQKLDFANRSRVVDDSLIYVLSQLYPLYLNDTVGSVNATIPVSANYVDIVLRMDVGLDTIGTAVASVPASGSYDPMVIIRDLGVDTIGTANASVPVSGSYIEVVIIRDLLTDSVGSATANIPTSGSYDLQVTVVDATAPPYTSPDSVGSVVAGIPLSGSYDPA